MTKPLIWLGIAGKKYAGKDTFAAAVRMALAGKPCVVRRRALADALKEEVANLLAKEMIGGRHCSKTPFLNKCQVLDAVNGDDSRAKERFRPLLQFWGTEFRRHYFGDDYWCEQLHQWAQTESAGWKPGVAGLILVPDIRFPQEVAFIRERGGLLVKVVRPMGDPADQHASETALDDYAGYDALIPNEGTRSDLTHAAVAFVRQHLEPRL